MEDLKTVKEVTEDATEMKSKFLKNTLNEIHKQLNSIKIESQKMLLEEIPVNVVSMIEKCLTIIASKALDQEISLFL
ncbi:hypothetical protein BCR32DRAFT_281765 [Anaeromyces robustus]|uniref:Uncharacterized protein n=1 Tax=Anaeromyces robustus TaxID=1754192 RepID=A0A1Y1WZI9_9FUNG|nr:hypothetical protein BCR32DRAFT_281765 [Anaeromyces robustus]|eukprot:ORX79007.1 hypothetical protein BCR32DRAFT_281765 [Anaeromyces robustus]